MTPDKAIRYFVGSVETIAVVGCLLYAEYGNNEDINNFFDLWPIWGTTILVGSFIQLIVMYPLEKSDD